MKCQKRFTLSLWDKTLGDWLNLETIVKEHGGTGY